MNSTRELSPLIGRVALLTVKGGMSCEVTVQDTRQVYARVDCLVQPTAGAGACWVSVDSLREVQAAPAGLQQPTAPAHHPPAAVRRRITEGGAS